MTISEKIANQVLDAELQFQFSRSSGPVGKM